MKNTYVITLKEFAENRNDFFLIDCRGDISDSDKGEREYNESHIDGAIFVSGEKKLSGIVREHGGRHPLPDFNFFIKEMEKIGISDKSNVVSYGFYSARLTLMLRMIGINSAVLSGKYENVKNYGILLNNIVPELSSAGKITAKPDFSVIKNVYEVLAEIEKKECTLIDSRAPERFSGAEEPIDRIGGHIPGAQNYFWQKTMNSSEEFLSIDELKKHFKNIYNSKIILYCGSGVSAAYNWIAMKECGIDPFIYSGSWSDWVSYDFTPIEKDTIIV